MLVLKLKKQNEDIIIFEYFPEGSKSSGEILINKSTGKIEVLKEVEIDKHGHYLVHAVSEIKKQYKTNNYLLETTVSWY